MNSMMMLTGTPRSSDILMPITTIQIDKETRAKLLQWDNSHFIGRRRTYDQILLELLEKA